MSGKSDAKKKELYDLFCLADTSGNGTLSIQEVAKVYRSAGSKMTDSEIAASFCVDDKNADQEMSFDEFWAAIIAKPEKEIKENDLRKIFRKFDVDGSGCLTESDLKSALSGQFSDDDIATMISGSDKNSDGKVNFEEFLIMWNSKL